MMAVQLSFAQVAFVGQSQKIDSLNSVSDEGFLQLSQDLETLYFTRTKSPDNVGALNNPGGIWQSTFGEGIWNNPVISDVEDPQVKGIIIGTDRGDKVLFAEVKPNFNTYQTELFIGSKDRPINQRPLEIPYFFNSSDVISGYLSADGTILLLSIEGRATYGVEDIYVSFRQGNRWTSLKNLSSAINTPFQEFTPFLSRDNENLYWATNGRDDGFGSFDIYTAKRLDDTWQRWSEPVNVGPWINTEGAETGFQLGSTYAYFISTQNSDGYGDIRRIKLKDVIDVSEEQDSVAVPLSESITLTFNLKDEETGALVTANVIAKSTSIDLSLDGTNSFEVPYATGEDIQVLAEAHGYMVMEKIITGTELDSVSQMDLMMVPLTIGRTIQLDHVLFHRGTDEFIEGSQDQLDQVVKILNENQELKILVKGHTDNQGDPSRNLALSQQRAKKVRDYILRQGFTSKRVQAKGYGGNTPIASNAQEETRRLNRRVEFTIIE